MPGKCITHVFWFNMGVEWSRLTWVLNFSLIVLVCNSGQIKNTRSGSDLQECSDTWIFKGNVSAHKLNDSVEQQIVDGKLWFEIISPVRQEDGSTRAYIRNYRMDGSLESEGYATYFEHPVADYTAEGKWKYYDCKGKLLLP